LVRLARQVILARLVLRVLTALFRGLQAQRATLVLRVRLGRTVMFPARLVRLGILAPLARLERIVLFPAPQVPRGISVLQAQLEMLALRDQQGIRAFLRLIFRIRPIHSRHLAILLRNTLAGAIPRRWLQPRCLLTVLMLTT
jgi:hypothetical protein